MKSSPIYNIISNPGRKSDCSFGSSGGFTQDIRVGTSSSNSHTLANISVQQFVNGEGISEFSLFIDGKLVKQGLLINKKLEMNIDRINT